MFNVKPVEHIESSDRIRINRAFASSQFILRGQFILFGSALVIEQWGSWNATKWYGIGSVRMRTTINFFHNRGGNPNHWVEKAAETSASHPKR
jgi:hypothetical protein